MTVTVDYQMEYNGLLVGADTPYDIPEIRPDEPGVSSGDVKVARVHGLHPGDDFLGGRSPSFEVHIVDPDHAVRAPLIDAFKAAFRMGEDESPLTFQIPSLAGGGVRRIGCRVRGAPYVIDLQHLYSTTRISVLLSATDPRIYDETQSIDTVSLPTAGGGLNFPITFPITFGAVSTGGTITANNAGTFDTPVVFRIDGPCTNPVIDNVTADKELALTLVVASGDYVEIDTAAKTVLLNGTASRYSALTTSEWFDLAPGDNQLDFRAVTATAATLKATWRSAWH